MDQLAKGKTPSGVRPFSLQVDVPALDNTVPDNLSKFTLDFSGLSVREAREKLYLSTISVQKELDNFVLKSQADEV